MNGGFIEGTGTRASGERVGCLGSASGRRVGSAKGKHGPGSDYFLPFLPFLDFLLFLAMAGHPLSAVAVQRSA